MYAPPVKHLGREGLHASVPAVFHLSVFKCILVLLETVREFVIGLEECIL